MALKTREKPVAAPTTTRRSSHRRLKPATVTGVAFALILAWIVLWPLIKLQQVALSDGAHSYGRLIQSPRLTEIVLTTAYLALGSVLIAVIIGTGLAWVGYNLPGRWRWLGAVPILGLTLPPLAQVTGWAFLLSPNVGYLNAALRTLPWWSGLETGPIDVFSVPMIVIITGLMLVPYSYLFVSTGMSNIDVALIEAARMSGATRGQVFRRIVLPVIRPAIAYSTIIVLLLGLGQFTAPLLLGQTSGVRVLTTEMYRVTSSFPVDTGLAAAYGSPLIIIGILLVVIQQFSLRNPQRFTVVSTRGQRRQAQPFSGGIALFMVYAVIALVLPIVANLIVALSPFWSGNIDWSNLGAMHIREVFSEAATQDAIGLTIAATLIALCIAMPLAYIAASIQVFGRGRRRLAAAIDLLLSAPLVLPGIVFGLGIVLAYSSGPVRLYGTIGAIVLAYVTIVLPFISRSLQSGFVASGQTFIEAARMSGAGTLRTHLRIVLPMASAAVATASALAIAVLSHEFSASVMVRSPGTEVMGTLLYRYWTTGTMGQVAVIALTMCVVTFVLIALAQLISRRLSGPHR